MIVDIHTHVAPPEFLAALVEAGGEVVPDPGGSGVLVSSGELKLHLSPEFLSPDAFVKKLDSLGIDLAVVSIATLLVDYRMDFDQARKVAAAANLGMARFASFAPERIRWLAHLPMQDQASAPRILEDAIASGALGAQIGTHVNGANLDEVQFKPFFAKAAELDAFLLVHAVDCMAAHRLERHYASNLIGNPYESGLAVASVIFGRVHEQRTPLQMCFCHGGGAAPALAARWDRAWSINRMGGTKLSQPPSSYFRSLWFDSLCYGEEQLRLLIALAGADRVLMGSDQPFPIAHPDPVSSISNLSWLTPAQRRGISGENAKKALLRL